MADMPHPLDQSVQQISDLVSDIALALVDKPESVSVQSQIDETEVILRLFVSEDDLGKLIGKQGRTARSLRAIVSAAGHKLHCHCALDIRSNE